MLVFLSCSFFAQAESKASLRDFLFSKFDSKISKALAASTQKDVEEALGKATLVEKSNLYYELEGFKYAVSVKLKGSKVQGLFYHPKIVKLTMSDFTKQKLIDLSKVEPVKRNGVDDGLFREYVDKKAGLRLVFRTNQEMSLNTVEVLK
jgi:hypothetical protein